VFTSRGEWAGEGEWAEGELHIRADAR